MTESSRVSEMRRLIGELTERVVDHANRAEVTRPPTGATIHEHLTAMLDNASLDEMPDPPGRSRLLKKLVLRLAGFSLSRQRATNHAMIGIVNALVDEIDYLNAAIEQERRRTTAAIGALQQDRGTGFDPVVGLSSSVEAASGARPINARVRSSKKLHVAVVKPDWNIRGGFELVLDRLVEHMQGAGHHVDMLRFQAHGHGRRCYGTRIDPEQWASSPLFFNYVSQVEAARAVDVGNADLVITTQPPSFVVDHPRHLSIFYHHIRPCYELGDVFVRAGLVEPEIHALATESVRRIDQPAIERVTHILAGSESVAERLRHYNGRATAMSIFHAGPNTRRAIEPVGADAGRHVLCVSRHDFPKRTELFVHAARLAPELPSVAVGTGGLLPYVKALDNRFSAEGVPETIDDTDLWLIRPPAKVPVVTTSARSNLRLAGAIPDDELDRLYRDAICVVAPALLEDYGLTVIEAMSYGKPVIVCNDGGHLRHVVQHGVNGLVVEPTGAAIAAAMRQLANDPRLTREMGAAARETAAAFTWDRAFREFDEGLEQVMS